MREERKTYLFCIKAENPVDFNNQTKAFCKFHNVTKITPYPDFLAYIEYEEREDVPETILEEYEQEERHTCGECPSLEQPTDGRRRRLICEKHGCVRWRNSPACEEFYRELKGELDEVRFSEIGRGHEGVGLHKERPSADLDGQPRTNEEPFVWKDGIHTA